ncbi:MAG: hypothetical protein AAFW73_04890 [Bacteroidota bacterium]
MNLHPGLPQSFEVLFQRYGQKVVYCYECQVYHIHYGTVSLDLTEAAIANLIQTFQSYYKFYRGNVSPEHRCIEVDTPIHGFRLLLSPTDLREFGTMLESAVARYQERERQRRLN